jgi:hypothetical protein
MVMAARFVGRNQWTAAAAASKPQQQHQQQQQQQQQQQHQQHQQQQQRHPWSTEQNTPWMLADYFIKLGIQQRRGNSEKWMAAEAQVDLFLCSNPDCDVIGDILMVDEKTSSTDAAGNQSTTEQKSQHSVAWGLAFSTVGDTLLTSPHSTARQITASHAVDANFTVLGAMWGSGNASTIQEIHYSMDVPVWTASNKSMLPEVSMPPGPDLLPERFRDDLASDYLQNLQAQQEWHVPGNPNTMPLSVFARLLAQNLTDYGTLSYGVFKARELLSADRRLVLGSTPAIILQETDSQPGITRCVLIILPRANQWMDEHGWNTSHVECLAQDISTMPMYVFDSYFYQAQFLGNRSKTTYISGSNQHSPDQADPVQQFGGGDLPKNITLQEVEMVVPFSHPMQPAQSFEEYKLAGFYGVSLSCVDRALYVNKMSWSGCEANFIRTQHYTGCVQTCFERMHKDPLYTCGNCSALEVGTATIAAYLIGKQYITPSAYLQEKLLALHFMHDWTVQRFWSMEKAVPWCQHSSYGLKPYRLDRHKDLFYPLNYMIRVGLTGLQNNTNYTTAWHESWAQNHTHENTIKDIMSVVIMCHYWDQQGVGYANRAWVGGGSQRIMGFPPTKSVLELLQVQLLDLAHPPAYFGEGFKWLDYQAAWSDVAVVSRQKRLRHGIEAVVLDAMRILQQQASIELATADATKTVAGAVLDIVMTLISSIAMASGCKDVAALFLAVLCKCCCTRPTRSQTTQCSSTLPSF